MISDMYIKNYVLLLFLGITIIFIYLKQNNCKELVSNFKIRKIEYSRKNGLQYSKLLKFKNSKNLEINNFQVSKI